MAAVQRQQSCHILIGYNKSSQQGKKATSWQTNLFAYLEFLLASKFHNDVSNKF
jgi:hypothetical protein